MAVARGRAWWMFPLMILAACSSSPPGSSPDGGGGSPGATVTCQGSPLLAVPADPSLPGPWPVGARTGTVAGFTTEVWYPATPGTDAGMTQARYDIRVELPTADQGKIP